MTKEVLALAWHAADSALDAINAPKTIRLTVAGVGLAWSAWWFFAKMGERSLVDCETLVREATRVHYHSR